ncbi:MAG: hypothetical protein ACP5I1_19605 [Candidatus Hinthialibacter sp.]
MKDWRLEFENWQGTAAELAQAVIDVSHLFDLYEDEITPNERLIRNYVQLEILDRPTRKGKEAFFGFTQLVQFLCARILVSDGWPLSKIADFYRTAELKDLLELLPKESEGNQAQHLIRRFKKESGQKIAMNRCHPAMTSTVNQIKDRVNYSEALRSLGHASPRPARHVMTRIELCPWCYVYVDSKAIQQAPAETLDALAIAFTHSLKQERYRKGE